MSKINVILSDLKVPNTGSFTDENLNNLKMIAVSSLILGLIIITFIVIIAIKKHQLKMQAAKNNNFKAHNNIKTFFNFILIFSLLGLGAFAINNQIAKTEGVFADENQNEETLSISVDDVTIKATLGSEDQFLTAKNTVTVETPTSKGYMLGVYAENQDLKLENNEEYAIKGLESEDLTTLSSNTWGIATIEPENAESKVWQAMPVSKDNFLTLKETRDRTAANDKTEVYYGVNVNDKLIAGTYSNTINYVAVVNDPSLITIEDAYNIVGKERYKGYFKMQEMNEEICSMVNVFEDAGQAQLIDIRDDKIYYVAKLADENCWMTQNLDHDIDSNRTYTSADTDLLDNTTWTPTRSTYATDNTTWSRDYDVLQSYDPGELYWTRNFATSHNSATPVETTTSGDPHFSIGNYYSTYAALAINNASDYNSEQSICPAGWTLPRIGKGEDSFYGLFDSYGFIIEGERFTNFDEKSEIVYNTPIYFIPSGNWVSAYNNESGNWESVYQDMAFTGSYGSSVQYSSTALSIDGLWLRGESGCYSSACLSPNGEGVSIRCIARPVSDSYEDVILNQSDYYCD